MELATETELFRAELQHRSVSLVRIEINLAVTFLRIGVVECSQKVPWTGSLLQAMQAVKGARKGLNSIASVNERDFFRLRIMGLEAAIQGFCAENGRR